MLFPVIRVDFLHDNSLISDLENVFSSARLHDDYLCQVSFKFIH